MVKEDYIKFALGANTFENHFKDKNGDELYIVESKSDIEDIKNSNQNKDFGYFKINKLSSEDIEFGYLPEAIIVDHENDISFNQSSIIVMIVM